MVSKSPTLHPAPTWNLGTGSLGRGCKERGSWGGTCRDWPRMALHEVFVRTGKNNGPKCKMEAAVGSGYRPEPGAGAAAAPADRGGAATRRGLALAPQVG